MEDAEDHGERGGGKVVRILVVCQHYWPEPFNSTDVCEGLVERGHEVTVLCNLPSVVVSLAPRV